MTTTPPPPRRDITRETARNNARPGRAPGLLFGQIHDTTAEWFDRHIGRHHTIPLEATPHVYALRGDPDVYLDYLRHSWRNHPARDNTPAGRHHQLHRFLEYAQHDIYDPIVTTFRADGSELIVDGTHRAAIHHVAGTDPGFRPVSGEAWVTKTIHNGIDRYGTKDGRPYATLYGPDHHPLIEGRRHDILDRHLAIDYAGTGPIIDLGSNIGAGTLLAAWANPGRGVWGYDQSPRHTTAALRLADYFATPINYTTLDLAATRLLMSGATVLAFSILAHLDDLTHLRHALRWAHTVYLEDHAPGHSLHLVADLFSQIEQLPTNSTRPLYKCTP